MQTLVLFVILGCGGGEPAPSSEATTSSPTAPTALDEVGAINVAGLKSAQAAGATIIDVRSDDEYASGHVPGTIHVPVGSVSPHHDAIKDLPKDEPLYMICESGGRSARAAKVLASAGYTTVNVEGGTRAWRNAGLPLEK